MTVKERIMKNLNVSENYLSNFLHMNDITEETLEDIILGGWFNISQDKSIGDKNKVLILIEEDEIMWVGPTLSGQGLQLSIDTIFTPDNLIKLTIDNPYAIQESMKELNSVLLNSNKDEKDLLTLLNSFIGETNG